MGEVIQIQLGQAGSRLGYSFWQQLLKEHNLDQFGQKFKGDTQQNENISNFFEQQSDKTFRARSIFADMEPHSLQTIMKSQLINVFPLENFCFDNLSTRNLWPIAFKGSPGITNQINQCIRREIERCQRCTGFQVLHSTCGGSGSGLGSLVQQIIQQNYNSSITMNLSGLPSPGFSNIVVEPYNSLLSIYKLHEAVGNPCIFFQNEAILRQEKKSLTFKKDYSPSSFDDVNQVLGKILVNITSPSRFPCDGNTGIRKMSTNMIEYPIRKYFVTSIPYTLEPNDKCIKTLIKYQAFNFKNLSLVYTGKIQKKRKWISNYIIFRGPQWTSFDINYRVQSVLKMKYPRGRTRDFLKQHFKEEIPNKYFVSVVKSQPRKFQNSITSLQLCSVIEDHLQHIHSLSSQMFRRKAFTHWYTSEGVQLQQIAEAQSSVLDIVSDYRSMTEDYSCYGEQQDHSQYDWQ